MYTIILMLIIGLVVGTIFWSSEYYPSSYPIYLFPWLLVSFILGFLIAVSFGVRAQTEERLVKSTEIVAIADGSGVSGSFFLGSGTVNDVQYYFYYQKEGDGFVQRKVDVSRAVVYEIDKDIVVPNVSLIKDTPVKKNRWVLAGGASTYKIYVPKGSITTAFNLDLQ